MRNISNTGDVDMKIAFISNYLSHHQKPLSDVLYKKLHGEYYFLETEQMTHERKILGWREEKNLPYLVRMYSDTSDYQRGMQIIEDSDVVIIGGTSDRYITKRLSENKLIFRYEERILKTSNWQILNPHTLWAIYKCHYKNRHKNVYLLSAGAYLPKELKLFHTYKNKMFQWGYFPETYTYEMDELFNLKKNEITEIVWSARFIDWKHPEQVVKIAKTLAGEGINFHITMIGSGELLKPISDSVVSAKIENYISFTGAVSPLEVRNYMEKANIFLATSDRQEGWGAVINEAMNSGCAVIANEQMGAVPYLIEDMVNGYIYKTQEECIELLKKLLNSSDLCSETGTRAYEKITEVWNAENAAEQLLRQFECAINNQTPDDAIKGPAEWIG